MNVSLRPTLKFLLPLALVFASLGVTPVHAALPVDLGDFVLEQTSESQKTESQLAESCLVDSIRTTDEEVIGLAILTLVGNEQLDCTVSVVASSTAGTDRGTVTNEQLGLNGTFAITCDYKQVTKTDYSIGFTGDEPFRSLIVYYKDFVASGMQTCSWVMNFTDSKKSSLIGSIESPIASATRFDEINKIFIVDVTVEGSVKVTGGSGLFAGVQGTAMLNQSGSLEFPSEIDLSAGFSSAQNVTPFANEATPPIIFSEMKLISNKGSAINFVSPSFSTPTKRVLGISSGAVQKVRLVSSPGARCTLSATVGKKTISLIPKAIVTKTGVVNTSFTAANIAKKFGLNKPSAYKNKTAKLSATCDVGRNKKNVTKTVSFTFADS